MGAGRLSYYILKGIMEKGPVWNICGRVIEEEAQYSHVNPTFHKEIRNGEYECPLTTKHLYYIEV